MCEELVSETFMRRFVPGIGPAAARAWATALSEAGAASGIEGRRARNHWLAQLAHECTGFTRFEESLWYSAKRIRQVWPSRFRSAAAATPFAGNPQALANQVYNGRMGNRDGSNDGWHFRGRGPKMITGRHNYTAFGRWLKGKGFAVEIRTSPEMLTEPKIGAMGAAWFWETNNLSAILARHPSEPEASRAVTKAINGGLIGLADRQRWLRRAESIDA